MNPGAIQNLGKEISRLANMKNPSSKDLNENYDKFESMYIDDERFQMTIKFWDSWIDESQHGYPGFNEGIKKDDWIALAQEIVKSLLSEQEISNPLLLKYFSRRVDTTKTGLLGRIKSKLNKPGK